LSCTTSDESGMAAPIRGPVRVNQAGSAATLSRGLTHAGRCFIKFLAIS
jgi:hypothetical protein